MNPWALLIMLLAICIIIIGFKGSQHRILCALKGGTWDNSTNNCSGGIF
jgi:hypothetical protein